MSNTRSRLRINSLVPESIVDGPGIRYVVFVQGCPHGCEGCHNPQTHDFEGGHYADEAEIITAVRENPLISGVTFSGGEPFCQAGALAILAAEIRALGKDIVTFSGYTYEELLEMAGVDPDTDALLRSTDILVDGPFILAERDLSLDFRGSRNQRVIYLRDGRPV